MNKVAATPALEAARRKVDRLAQSCKRLGDQERRAARAPAGAGGGAGNGRDRKALRDEALSRMGGNAYLLGAGGMTMAGAAIGGGAAAVGGG